MISFAGGLPAPELFDAPGLRDGVRRRARATRAAGRSLQYSTTEGDPALRAAVAARLTARGLPTERRRAADHQRLAAGAHADRDRAARAGRHGARRGAVLPRGAAGVPARRRRASCRSPCDDDGLDPEAAARARRAPRRAAALHDPDLPEPDRPHAAARAPRGARRARARAPGFWLLEDDPYGELRYRGEPLPPLAALPGAERPRAVAVDAVEDRRARAADRLGARARARCAAPLDDRQAGGRPALLDGRPGRRRALAGDRRPRRARRRAAARPTARAATRCSPGSRDALPARLDAQPARRRHVRLGAAARRLGRRRAARARARARRRVRARLPVLRRRRPTPRRCGSRSRRTRRRRSPRACAACAPPGATSRAARAGASAAARDRLVAGDLEVGASPGSS